jgi:hypothetical protein
VKVIRDQFTLVIKPFKFSSSKKFLGLSPVLELIVVKVNPCHDLNIPHHQKIPPLD